MGIEEDGVTAKSHLQSRAICGDKQERGDVRSHSGARGKQSATAHKLLRPGGGSVPSSFRALLRLDFIEKVTRSQQEFLFVSLAFTVQDF